MGKFERIIIYGISVVSFILSIAALCRTYPRYISYEECNLGFDYMGVIVGALALLVGFLVAWQIYKTIDVDKKIAMMSNSSRDAIAEDMFYRGYSNGMGGNGNSFFPAMRACVAALNLNFTEEKAACFLEIIEYYEALLRNNIQLIDKTKLEIDKIRFKSKSIDKCYKILAQKKKEAKEYEKKQEEKRANKNTRQ
nr:MAG TPA: hypothetical protein [Caudoviricetes sp.]